MNPAPAGNTASTVKTIIITVAVVVVLLGGFYIWANRSQPETTTPATYNLDKTPVPPVAEVQPATQQLTDTPPIGAESVAPATPVRPIVPPPAAIDNSDNQVKLALADLSSAMAPWAVSDQQIRKWVLAIDVMADGDVPKQYRPLSYPLPRFEVDIRGMEPQQQFFMKPESYKRSDLFVNAIVAIDPVYLAQYYQAWLPVLEKAYKEQGKKDTFDQRFRLAIQHMLDAKPLSTVPELAKRGGVIYVYADPKLESASDVEKMMWRMGPDNSVKIQNYLRLLLTALPKK